MTFGLIHHYSDRNIGDAAIEAGLRHLCARADPGAAVRIAAPGTAVHEDDTLISVGGDIFNNGRPGLITRRFLTKLREFDRAPGRTILFGQSIPPSCSGVSLWALARRLRHIHGVWVRDRESVHKLEGAGVRAMLTVDAAFALTEHDADITGAEKAFHALGTRPEQVALMSLRSFNRMYPADGDRFLWRMASMARRFAEAGMTPVLLAHADVDHADADNEGARALQELCPAVRILNPFSASGADWRLAFGAIASAGLVVGPRYHMAVLRLAAGRMPCGLWYSNKGADLQERFGVPGGCASRFDPARMADTALSTRSIRFDPVPLRVGLETDFMTATSLRLKAAA